MLLLAALLLAACGAESLPVENAVADGPAAVVADARPAAVDPAPARSPDALPSPEAAVESLESFWTRFRTAALAGDAAAIRSLSAPVVLQRGMLDDTPVVRLPAARVPAALAQVLQLPDGVDDASRTHRELIEATPTPRRNPEWPDDQYRFGNLVFERGASGWRLTALYLEPQE